MYYDCMNSKALFRTALAAELRAEMARQGRNLTDLAEALNVAPYTAKMRHNGTIAIDADDLDKIAPWLGLRASELLARAEQALASAEAA